MLLPITITTLGLVSLGLASPLSQLTPRQASAALSLAARVGGRGGGEDGGRERLISSSPPADLRSRQAPAARVGGGGGGEDGGRERLISSSPLADLRSRQAPAALSLAARVGGGGGGEDGGRERLISSSPPADLRSRQAPAALSLAASSNVLEVLSVKTSSSTSTTSASRHRRIKDYGVANLRDLDVEQEWVAKVNFGGEDVYMILDTGSSDTWLVQEGFQCLNAKGNKVKEARCMFGPTYNASFTEGGIPNENFNITYGDGEFLAGVLGYSDVTIGGIKVEKQEVALVTRAYWEGDGISSGLMGLAYSSITSAFAGNDSTIDNQNVTGTAPGDQEPYSPIVQSMIAAGLNPPLFSMALQRSSSTADNTPGGYIAFGGLPPVSANPADFISTPILIHEWLGYPPLEASQRSFYTVQPDGYSYPNAKGVTTFHSTNIPAIIDSGTTFLYAPTPVYSAWLAAFPSDTVVMHQGAPYVCCSIAAASVPYFGVKIAGATFKIDSADLVLPYSVYGGYVDKKTGEEYCSVGVADGGSGAESFPILGDVFLKNVVAVFDVGGSVVQLAQHDY